MQDRGRWLLPGLAIGLPLVLFLLTCSRTVGPVDAGELIVAASTGGVAHPPGFPLFLLLGRLFTLIPVGTAAFQVAALSAVTSALAALGIYLTACCLLEGPGRRLLALGGALLAATSSTVWEWATVAEVYGLNLCLATLVLWGVARWLRAEPGSVASRRSLILVACLGGLGATNHTSTFAVLGLATLVTLLVPLSRPGILRVEARQGRTVLLVLAALLLPLLLYLYLPLAARSGSAMNWGDPRDLPSLWRHLTAWQYREYLTGADGSHFVRSLLETLGTFFLPLWLRQWGPWGCLVVLPALALGLYDLARRHRGYLLFLVVLVGSNILLGCVMQQSDDKSGYFAPTMAVTALVAALGLGELARRLGRSRLALGLAMALALLVALAGLLSHWSMRDRSAEDDFERYARNVAGELPRDALLLTANWQLLYPPLLYLQECEDFRPDLHVWDVRMMTRSWYLETLLARTPGLQEAVRDEWEAFRPHLRGFEEEDPRYYRDGEELRQLNQTSDACLRSMFRFMLRRRPVYLTRDVAYPGTYPAEFYEGFLGRQLGPALLPSLQGRLTDCLRPERLVIRAFPEGEATIPPLPAQGLDVGDLYEPGGATSVYQLRLRDLEYLAVLARRARELARQGRLQLAEEALQAALAIGESATLRHEEGLTRGLLGDEEGRRAALSRALELYHSSAGEWEKAGDHRLASRMREKATELEGQLSDED